MHQDDEYTDDELEVLVWKFLEEHYRTLLKAPITATMLTFAVSILGSSVLKGLIIGAICLVASCFTTWRRYLEPISLSAFLVAVIFFAYPDITTDFRAALRALTAQG